MEIAAVKRDTDNNFTHFKLDNGKVITANKAINMVKDNKLPGYNVASSKEGVEYIRANPDGDMSNNLDNLPTFS